MVYIREQTKNVGDFMCLNKQNAYEKLINEFQKKLRRTLTEKEKCFLKWVAQKEERERE